MTHTNAFARFLSETDALNVLPEHPEQEDPEPMFDPIAELGADRIRRCRAHITSDWAQRFDDTGRLAIEMMHVRRPPTSFTPDGQPEYPMDITDLFALCLMAAALLFDPLDPDRCIDSGDAARHIFFGRDIEDDEVHILTPGDLQRLIDMALYCYLATGG